MNRIRPNRTDQHGAALVVVLLLLLVMTLLGIASLSGTLMEEHMSAAQLDRGLSFQAAEAALREGEAVAQGGPSFPSSGCSDGLCAMLAQSGDGTTDRWRDSSFTGWKSAASVGTLTATPQYIIESMGQAPNWTGCEREVPVHPRCLAPRYRITARSTANDRASVILQSSYLPR